MKFPFKLGANASKNLKFIFPFPSDKENFATPLKLLSNDKLMFLKERFPIFKSSQFSKFFDKSILNFLEWIFLNSILSALRINSPSQKNFFLRI